MSRPGVCPSFPSEGRAIAFGQLVPLPLAGRGGGRIKASNFNDLLSLLTHDPSPSSGRRPAPQAREGEKGGSILCKRDCPARGRGRGIEPECKITHCRLPLRR